MCYYLRLNDKEYRKVLAEKLNKFYEDKFLSSPEREIKKITQEMSIEEGKGIALNRALRENLFTCFICIDNNIPLIIVGKPGTGKSLSFQILYNTLKGEYSEKPMFKEKGKLYRYYYQGSETSTAEGIEKLFEKAINSQEKNKGKNIISLVFFDEMGLAERSSNNPLKVIHYLLERDGNDKKQSVPFLGISNWKLDAAKINRALSLTITDYDIKDLEETAIAIAGALDKELSVKYKYFFEALARTYYEFIEFNQKSLRENKDFHGNRDFYNLIKTAMRELIENRNNIENDEKKILTEVGIQCLNINFGGLENSTIRIKEFFKKIYDKFDENINIEGNFSILDAIKKNILDTNSRYLMLISDGNDGSDIVKYLLDSLDKKYIELVGSKYKNDMKSGRYTEEILNKIKYIMGTDNVLILRDLDIIYPSLYDLFNQNFTIMGDKRFARIAFEFSKISSEVHKYFHAIVIVTKTQIQNLKLDPPFLNRFEKHIVNFKMLLDEIDIEIAKRITEFIDIISSFGHEKKLKINLEKSLINCKEHNIEGLIFKIKNDLKQNKIDENDVNDNYENTIIRKVFDKIVPTFCQDIIASTITCKLETKYKSMYDMVIEIYKKTKYNNFKSFFQNIQTEKSIVYTYTKITENLFDEETEITNKFGTFNIKNSKIEIIESIKSENDLIFILKEFKEQNQNILILKFAENDTNKVNSVNFIIENYIKDNQELKDKLIMFIIHRQRQGIKEKDESLKKKVMPDFISFINDDYYQIFIDNLQGNENNNILKFLEKKNEENLAKEYIDNSNFIENKIFTVLNYMKYNILYETSELNLKNYTTRVAEKIMKSEIIKSYIQKNIKSQSKTIKGIIKDTFISDIDENDIDFFEVINSKLTTYFVSYLLNIIFFSFKENVLNQMLINPNLEFLLQNEFINNIIINNFNKIKFNFVPKLKLGISQNKIDIYNGLIIPKSKNNFDIIIKYINDGIAKRYIDNEESLRKNYKNEDNIEKAVKTYYTELEKFENNVKIEINKNELFNIIYNQNYIEIKKCLLEDYFKYFIIIYLEKNKNNFQINEKLLHFLKLIIKIKLSDNHNQNYDFDYTMNEFIKIIVFTQSYKEDIKNLFTTFISIIKYSENIDEYILNILNEGIIKYEISERNKNYTQIVNNTFYIIIESMIRGALLSSAKLLKNDKVKFYEFFYSLTSIEANLQKINKKFYLFSKEIFNIRTIIKIEEGYKSNHEEFEQNYDNFIKNLLQQSIDLYDCNYNNFYNIILELNKIINETLTEKNDRYGDLLFFLFMQEFKNISDPDIRIKLIEEFFKNNILIRKSKIFLSETLKDLKPEIFNENKKKKDSKDTLIDNFLNLKNEKLKKFQSLIKIYNNIKSEEFNEILLYLFESQCQLYFSQILNKYKNEYNEKCCNEIINGLSLEYLKKAITTLYQNDNENNITKLYAIAYLKTYCYYYVEINYKYFDKADFTQLNILLMDKDDNNEIKNSIRNMRNIYIWRLYCKKFENFDQFISSDLSAKNIPIYKELDSKLKKEKDIPYIFANCFISPKKFDNYRKLDINDLNNDIIKEDFDSFYCFLVNKFISHLYGKNKGSTIQKLKEIYNNTSDIFDFEEEGKKLYQILLENEIFEKEIIKKINDNPLDQDDFEIILYSFRFIFNIHINNKKCFYNQLIKKNAKKFINDNYMPGNMALVNEFLKSYYILLEKLKKREDLGYYTCKDCGFLYNVEPCTFPMAKGKCPNGHDIGGEEHVLVKKSLNLAFISSVKS